MSGGQTMNPSTEDILHAAEQVPAMDVYVLPNNKNIVMAAEQAARLARTSGVRRIHVVPTTTIPQGISAMMAYDESAEIKDNVEAMQEAAEHVQSGTATTTGIRSTRVSCWRWRTARWPLPGPIWAL